MNLLVDAISWVCILGGSIFCVIGGVGMLRMPDFYARTHAASLTDTLGAGLILVGLMFQAGFSPLSFKLLSVLVLLYLASPTSTHALVTAAYAGGMSFRGKAAEAEEKTLEPSC